MCGQPRVHAVTGVRVRWRQEASCAATYTAVSLDVITAQRVEDLVTPGDWSLVGPTARG